MCIKDLEKFLKYSKCLIYNNDGGRRKKEMMMMTIMTKTP